MTESATKPHDPVYDRIFDSLKDFDFGIKAETTETPAETQPEVESPRKPPQSATPHFLTIALELARRGFKVTPLDGKRPILTGWNDPDSPNYASSDGEVIAGWAKEYPSANAGIVTCPDHWSVDFDQLDWFHKNAPSVPKTAIVKTGSGKFHFHFKGTRPAWLKKVPNPAFVSKEATPLESANLVEFPDQVVGPGSIHPVTGKLYTLWQDESRIECPSEWLTWLRSLYGKKQPSTAKLIISPEWNPEIEFEKAGLKYHLRKEGDTLFFEYHAAMKKCLLKGDPHHNSNGQVDGSKQSRFVVSKLDNGWDICHQCFSSCGHGHTKEALAALDINLKDIIVKADYSDGDFFSDGDLTTQFVASDPALKYARDERVWFGYKDGVWQQKDTPKFEIEAFLRSIEPTNTADPKVAAAIHRRLTSIRAVSAVRTLAEDRPQLKIEVQQFDPDPMLVGLPDGEVLNLRTGERRAATPSDLITRALPVTPKGRCERWLQYLEQAHPNDPELISYLQRWAGYCLTAWTKEDMILFLIGVGGSGKGTFAEPLQKLLGDYCVSIPIGMLLEDTAEDRRLNYIASLRGARLAICNEGSKMRRLDSRGIKLLTGGGWLTGRRLGHQPINFKATHKIVILANDNPVLEMDDAMRQRVHVVPFNQKFRGEKTEEKGLREFFTQPEQLQGIFAWMVEGCLAYQREGLKPPASVTTTTEQFFEDADLLERFLKDNTEDAPNHFQPTATLFQRWERYCLMEGDKYAIGTMRTFVASLKSKCPHLKFGRITEGTQKIRGVYGIKLLPVDEPTFEGMGRES